MTFSVLNPPNSVALSDHVTGSVVQRMWTSRNEGGGFANWKGDVEELSPNKQRPQRQTYRQAPYPRPTIDWQINTTIKGSGAFEMASPTNTTLTSVANTMQQTNSVKSRKRRSYRTSDLETATQIISSIQAANHPISAELQAIIVTEALKKKSEHREHCRVNQARYRQRQQKVGNDIEAEIAQIQSEIKELEARCQKSPSLPAMPKTWALATEYFRHFQQFMLSPSTQHATAAKFLRGVLAPDVVGTSSLGVEDQIEKWRLFALSFGDIFLELRSMNMPTADTLVATSTTTVTITHNTLRYAFPHLNSDGNGGYYGGKWSPLAAKLLNQRFAMHGSVVFGYGNPSGQVTRLQTRMDMLSPLLKLLGSLEEVSCVFMGAVITPECQIARRE